MFGKLGFEGSLSARVLSYDLLGCNNFSKLRLREGGEIFIYWNLFSVTCSLVKRVLV